MAELGDIEQRVTQLDLVLEPIINQPVDVSSLESFQALMAAGPPRIEPGIEAECESLLRGLLTHYVDGDDVTRATVRRILRENEYFQWAAHVPWQPTAEVVRLEVLCLSARDGGTDMRDEIVTLDDLCTKAGNAGIEIAPILHEVAEISSDRHWGRMGSMKELLLDRAGRYVD